MVCFYTSYAGRLELIRLVIQGVDAFWLQNIAVPSTIIDRINKMCRRFLWADSKPKVEWKDICVPREEGGLSLKDCKTWNKAMLFRILWDIHSNKNSLWVKWIHSVYLQGRNFWQWTLGSAEPPLFKNLFKLRNMLISTTGSVQNAIVKLTSWNLQDKFSTALAYKWLKPNGERKIWMSMIWK